MDDLKQRVPAESAAPNQTVAIGATGCPADVYESPSAFELIDLRWFGWQPQPVQQDDDAQRSELVARSIWAMGAIEKVRGGEGKQWSFTMPSVDTGLRTC